jgi:hypothetical protein
MNIHTRSMAIALAFVTMIAPASAQTADTHDSAPRAVTVIGCVQRESDYRSAHDAGSGGPLGFGFGRGNEYVLVNAVQTRIGQQPSPEAMPDCSGDAAAGAAYELEGAGEGELEALVGRRVEVSGTIEAAEVDPATGRPTGGVDPLNDDLQLFELEVASFREPPVPQRADAPPAPATVTRHELPPQPLRPVPPQQPPAEDTAGGEAPPPHVRELPQTASPLPLAGLIGLATLAGAFGLRSRRRS